MQLLSLELRVALAVGAALLAVVVATIAVAIALMVVQLIALVRTEPPLAFSQAVYQPAQAAICAGDVLRWQSVLYVHDGPVWVDRERTIQTPSPASRTIWTDPAQTGAWWQAGDIVTSTITLTVPATLEPGRYEVRAGGVNTIRPDAMYTVPFQVLPC